MIEPKISIIIPVYNVEKYLRECLDSCINQTLADIEIICVDDCSPDNSIKILEEYQAKDYRIKIFRHEKNKNLGAARNTGIQNAIGEYVWFVDSDDYIDIVKRRESLRFRLSPWLSRAVWGRATSWAWPPP